MAIDFSVVIPTFRRPKELLEAIQSVLSQEEANVEVIVVDDSPEGGARETVEALGDARVAYRKLPVPTGGKPSIVRNHGWPAASGTFTHFLDDDDVVPAGHYRRIRRAFAEHPEVGVVFGVVEPFASGEHSIAHEQSYFADAARRARACVRFGPSLAFSSRMLFERTMIVCSNCIVRTECVKALGGFDPEILLVEDVDFYARAMRRYGALFIDEVTLKYRIGPSLMHSPRASDAVIVESYRKMHLKYRETYGRADFYARKVFTRTLMRVI